MIKGRAETKDVETTGLSTLIVVDDDLATLSAMKRVFRSEPYEAWFTDDPYEALRRMKSRRIDAVIADEFMPAMLGTDLLEAAGRHAPNSALIVLTGYPQSRDSIRAYRRRVDLVITKPWDDDYLRNCVRGLLEVRQKGT